MHHALRVHIDDEQSRFTPNMRWMSSTVTLASADLRTLPDLDLGLHTSLNPSRCRSIMFSATRSCRERRTAPTKPVTMGSGRKDPPVLAFLFRGDVDLPAKSSAYALFRDNLVPSLAASDLIA
jgi:hypothetical protein